VKYGQRFCAMASDVVTVRVSARSPTLSVRRHMRDASATDASEIVLREAAARPRDDGRIRHRHHNEAATLYAVEASRAGVSAAAYRNAADVVITLASLSRRRACACSAQRRAAVNEWTYSAGERRHVTVRCRLQLLHMLLPRRVHQDSHHHVARCGNDEDARRYVAPHIYGSAGAASYERRDNATTIRQCR